MKNSECLEKLVAMVNDIAKTNLAFHGNNENIYWGIFKYDWYNGLI